MTTTSSATIAALPIGIDGRGRLAPLSGSELPRRPSRLERRRLTLRQISSRSGGPPEPPPPPPRLPHWGSLSDMDCLPLRPSEDGGRAPVDQARTENSGLGCNADRNASR